MLSIKTISRKYEWNFSQPPPKLISFHPYEAVSIGELLHDLPSKMCCVYEYWMRFHLFCARSGFLLHKMLWILYKISIYTNFLDWFPFFLVWNVWNLIFHRWKSPSIIPKGPQIFILNFWPKMIKNIKV